MNQLVEERHSDALNRYESITTNHMPRMLTSLAERTHKTRLYSDADERVEQESRDASVALPTPAFPFPTSPSRRAEI
jgi:hypothetical protein